MYRSSSSPHPRRVAILVGATYIFTAAQALPVDFANSENELGEPSTLAASNRNSVRGDSDPQLGIFDSERLHDATIMATPTPSPAWPMPEAAMSTGSSLVSPPTHRPSEPQYFAVDPGCPVPPDTQWFPIASLTISCCTFVTLIVFVVYFFVYRWRFRREYLAPIKIKSPIVKKPSQSFSFDTKGPATPVPCPPLRKISEDPPPHSKSQLPSPSSLSPLSPLSPLPCYSPGPGPARALSLCPDSPARSTFGSFTKHANSVHQLEKQSSFLSMHGSTEG